MRRAIRIRPDPGLGPARAAIEVDQCLDCPAWTSPRVRSSHRTHGSETLVHGSESGPWINRIPVCAASMAPRREA